MRKELKRKKNELLHEWITRVCDRLNIGDEIHELMTDISKQSYIDGSNDAVKVMKNDE